MRHLIILPDLGQTTTEAKIIRWWKQPGERISRGEPLLAVETDKVDMDVESFANGYLRKILVEEGAIATALKPVAILTDSPEEPYAEASETRAATQSTHVDRPTAQSSRVLQGHHAAATPAAKALARNVGVDVSAVFGTGPNGLVVRRDVEQAARGRDAKDSRRPAAMAAIVAASKREIPHFYASIDADVAAADTWRGRWNASHPDLPVSWNDIFVRCASRALREVPRLNTAFEDGRYLPASASHLLMVVASESGLSLVEVPEPGAWEPFLRFMKNAAQSEPRSVLAGSEPGSRPLLAVSNLGMFGVKEFAAIIPPGCTAVLAIGAVRDAPVVRDGRVTVSTICTLTLSADHRVADGVTAARFLKCMQDHLNSI